jgi:hypothetical protein
MGRGTGSPIGCALYPCRKSWIRKLAASFRSTGRNLMRANHVDGVVYLKHMSRFVFAMSFRSFFFVLFKTLQIMVPTLSLRLVWLCL